MGDGNTRTLVAGGKMARPSLFPPRPPFFSVVSFFGPSFCPFFLFTFTLFGLTPTTATVGGVRGPGRDTREVSMRLLLGHKTGAGSGLSSSEDLAESRF